VQKTRWYPTSGSLDHFFDDELVAASRGVQMDLLHKVEPFPSTSELKPYDPGFLSGWVVEQYQIDLVAAAENARRDMDQQLEKLCAAQIPGDTYRNLRVHADYSGQTWKHILVPLWLVSYTYGARVFQVLVNGFTGTIAGTRPWSAVKIFFAVVAVLIAIWIFVSLKS